MSSSLSSRLTDEQKNLVAHPDGHALVSAVAGSGKTTALLYRIEHLLEVDKIPPHRILVLMFNTDARETFESRLRSEFSFGVLPNVMTFHAFALKMLRDAEKRFNFSFSIEEKDDVFERLLEEAVQRANQSREGMEMEPLTFPQDKIPEILNAIQILKNLDNKVAPGELPDPDAAALAHGVFTFYESLRKKKGVVRLDDLLYEVVSLMRAHPAWADEWAKEYDHILVDEYQDSNALQQWMIVALSSGGARVMVVGDEDQCIYRWRGADPGYMTRQFIKDFPDATRYALRWTFRYGHSISLMANHVLKSQGDRSDKICLSRPSVSTLVEVHMSQAPEDVLFSIMSQGQRPMDSIVLVREFHWLDSFEWRLFGTGLGLTTDIPGLSVRPMGKAISHLLDLTGASLRTTNPSSYEAARAYLKWIHPEAHPDMARHIAYRMVQEGWYAALTNVFKKGVASARFSTAIARALVSLRKLEDMGTQESMTAWWENMSHDWESQPWMAIATKRIQSLDMTVFEFQDMWDNMGFVSGWRATSIHRAKGGGWDNVVLGPLIDPEQRGKASVADIEEERRIFYVGITRAKKHLHLLSPYDAALSLRQSQNIPMDPPSSFEASRFLFESHPGLCQAWQTAIQSGEIPHNLWETPVIRRYRDEIMRGLEDQTKRKSFAAGLMTKIAKMTK